MQPDWAAGRLVGRYIVHERIAAGGMATVHLGRLLGDGGFSRTVAIKRLHDAYARDPEFVAMLLDEARLASKIRHPNVVPTLDVVAEQDQLLVVMEYVEGESLASLSRFARNAGERIPIPLAASIVAQALHGLHAAHECRDNKTGEPLGIVHRDVSPQNVLVGIDGIARVLDFGIAKAASRAASTADGHVKGKVAYMAPEQLQHGVVDRRTDVFAAAIMFWELLAGRRLFAGDSPAQTMGRVLFDPIDCPRRWAPDVPTELALIALRGLERDPNARFATAEEMALAIEDAIALPRSKEIGAWVSRVAAASVSRRAELVRALERTSNPLRAAPTTDPDLLAAITEADRRRQVSDQPTEVNSTPSSGLRVPSGAMGSAKVPSSARRDAVVIPSSAAVAGADEQTDLATVNNNSAGASLTRRTSWGAVVLAAGGSGIALALAVALIVVAMRARLVPQSVAAPGPPTTSGIEPPPAAPPPEPPPLPMALGASAPKESAAPPTASPPASSALETKKRPAPPAPRTSKAPDCRTPYVLDEKGMKHFKVECL
jgi:serine/threonine-protein kinase